ncbi:methionine--tRNA ligase subunit beta [Candidatus Woesearchaeota archaeon]|nr:methionine--tRNA ligase subunit beta [Candidatus Woesearchaeota archaeon]
MVIIMDTISFEDWQKIDIRVGTVKEAALHPDADKLLILKIDEGKDELRQLVAGLKEYYKPEELVGKKIVFLANLEPKPLRGEMSNGMILAAVEGDSLALVTVDKEIPNNAKIQ